MRCRGGLGINLDRVGIFNVRRNWDIWIFLFRPWQKLQQKATWNISVYDKQQLQGTINMLICIPVLVINKKKVKEEISLIFLLLNFVKCIEQKQHPEYFLK